MDAGAVVANPNRFNDEFLPDGSQAEVSALQRYYNEVARIGQIAVSTGTYSWACSIVCSFGTADCNVWRKSSRPGWK